jgi:hypothetical protein
MVEGMLQLIWAEHKPRERTDRWRAYVFAHDWKLYRRMLEDGTEKKDEKLEKELLDKIETYKDYLLKYDGKTKLESGQTLSNRDFHSNWTGMSLSNIAESPEVDKRYLYDRHYSPASDWAHFSIAGVARALGTHPQGAFYSGQSARDTVFSLVAAIDSLKVTLEITDRSLGLGLDTMIKFFYHRFNQWHKELIRKRKQSSKTAAEDTSS